ncbi:hypothetical protein PMKS-001200 [Pichia membranifaciens]|uniref:Uncharacterized protein n=1 Tax=Pichia membranifaciens TaxID=4926 RepID=A0A1Q2YDW8_9ASCO|nr:hypothetical protein PMKS-001200 [Pichia membranifaciens]
MSFLVQVHGAHGRGASAEDVAGDTGPSGEEPGAETTGAGDVDGDREEDCRQRPADLEDGRVVQPVGGYRKQASHRQSELREGAGCEEAQE